MASTSTGLNSDKNMLYCAVHFFNEDKVEAVPTTWLTMSTDNTIECWWPSETKNFYSLLKSRVLPSDQENWTREPCKIIKHYATLLEARRKTRNVEDNRNSTSEEEYRRLRTPFKSNFASLNSNLTSAATDYSNSHSPASSGICSEEVYQCLDEINKKHNVIIDKLQTLEMQQKIIFEEMDALKIRTLESNRSKSVNKAEVYTLEGFTTLDLLPLNSIEEVEDFEVALENEQIKSKYVAHVKIFATPKPDVTIRNCLNSVYTSTLATKCAWTGLKNNYSIKNLKQIAIIEESNYRSTLLLKADYKLLLSEVKETQRLRNSGESLSSKQYRSLKRYDLLNIGQDKKLIAKRYTDNDDIRFYVYLDQLFDIIHAAHINTGHKREKGVLIVPFVEIHAGRASLVGRCLP
ncbi:hypothetical protein RN001_009588 [Aquatica leii]|uniref:DUF4806 domain-containing protein n=1 Tax=Aquatica leii TaxID=1421715 RepID=A0AAN7SDY5_9COLE|nr:hypothetical protein RN001_009588 [Aquatica leii]